jgi:hypothetical protein
VRAFFLEPESSGPERGSGGPEANLRPDLR